VCATASLTPSRRASLADPDQGRGQALPISGGGEELPGADTSSEDDRRPGSGYPGAMRLLAIDTAFEACSVAVAAGEAEPVIRSDIVDRAHAEHLMPMIADAMAEAGLTFADLDRIAVTVGPGSFTGLRIGIAAARGLALVTGAEAVGIGTLAVHAEEARAELGACPILALIAAGRGEVYAQSFADDGSEEGPAEVGPPITFARRMGANTLIAGSGADALAPIIGQEAEARTVHRRAAPDPAALIRLARAAPPAGAAPRPLYLRPPDAKPQTAAAVARR
jgi:tRNA threonylcarbamoyladenosine biosynthesis protein TsaB